MEALSTQKEPFVATSREWVVGLAYLLSLTLIGLQFWPAIIVALLILFNHFKKNQEAFIVELFILCTYSGFIDQESLAIKLSDVLMGVSVLILFLRRFDKTVRMINIIILVYFVGVFFLASLSDEPMSVQIRTMRYYFCIITYIIPFVILRNVPSSFLNIGKYLILYSIIICTFYIIDGFVLKGHAFLPHTPGAENSVWYNPDINLSLTRFPRIYPPGLYILIPAAYYMARYYKLPPILWLMIILAFAASRTMTFISGFIAVYVFAIPNRQLVMKYTKTIVIGAVLLYIVDANTGSFLRISSTVDQFLELKEAIETDDIEKISEFGSGRLAQILPKFDKLIGDGKLMTGFGFIHPQESNRVDLLIDNEYYKDISKSVTIEMPTAVEVTQAQTILNIGIIGLFFQIAIYVFLAVVISKRLKEWKFFVGVLIGVNVTGLGSMIGLITLHSLWLALALGLTLIPGCKEPTSEISSIEEKAKVIGSGQ